MKELVQAVGCETLEEKIKAITYGEKGDCFYIILKGVVSVQIPNPKLKNWKQFREEYILEEEWKEDID